MSVDHREEVSGANGYAPPPTPSALREEHLYVLRMCAAGRVPNRKSATLFALHELRRWNMVLSSSYRLTPLGEKTLHHVRHRAALARLGA